MTEWTKEYSNTKPQEFQKASSKTWIQRKNIKEDYNGNGWTDEMRFLTNDEYKEVKAQKDLISDTVKAMTENLDLYKEGYEAAMVLLGEST